MPLKELYFAYGSNLNVGQMAVRCPMAQLVCRAVLEGYELAFRCGVLTILPKAGGRIDGILWKVNDRDERALDRYEGYPHLYTKELLPVQTDSGPQTVVAYVMTAPYCEKAQPPSPAYESAFSPERDRHQSRFDKAMHNRRHGICRSNRV